MVRLYVANIVACASIALLPRVSWGMEVDGAELPPRDRIIKGALAGLGGGGQKANRASLHSLKKPLTTRVMGVKGIVGKKTLGKPIKVKAAVSAQPTLQGRATSVTPILDLNFSRSLPAQLPGDIELRLNQRLEREGSVGVFFKVSF